jgi:hypothetical protein
MPPPWLIGEKRRGRTLGKRICNNKVRCNWERPGEHTWGNLENNMEKKVIGNFENMMGT